MGNLKELFFLGLLCIAKADTDQNKDLVGIASPFEPFWAHLSNLEVPSIITMYQVLSENQLKTLQNNVILLEDAKDESTTWREDRPFLLELVDPLKYSFVHGVTTINTNSSLPTNLNISDTDSSKTYQLLPTEITTDKSGNVSIKSYINSLHPKKYSKLYTSLEPVIQASLPLFEKIIQSIMTSPKGSAINEVSLNNRKLQMIISIKEIILPPNATYGGSDWHQEGLKNEHIVASTVFYFDVDNIKNVPKSQLNFRVQLDATHEKFKSFESVLALTNKIVTFPNIYEHKLEPFTLEDKSKPGHRKLVVLFLVDPSVRIISTKDVLPQQESWKEGGSQDAEGQSAIEGLDLGKESGCCMMTVEMAKKYYLLAAKERKHDDKDTTSRGKRKVICNFD